MLYLPGILILSLALDVTSPVPPPAGAGSQAVSDAASTDARWKELRTRGMDLRQLVSDPTANPDERRRRLEALLLEADAFVATHPDHRSAWELVTNLRAELGDSAGVDQAAMELQRLRPGDIQAGLSWITYYVNREQFDEALRVTDRLLADTPDSLMYVKAWVLSMSQVDPANIDRRFEAALADPARTQEAILLANAYQQTDPWAAQAWSPKMLAAVPDHPRVIETAARGLRGTNQFAKAREALANLPEEHFDDPRLAYLHSDCFYADHHFERAYEIMASIDLDDAEATAPGLSRRLRTLLPLREKAIESWNREQLKRAEDAQRGDNPRVRLTIDGQPVIVELFHKETPRTAAAFLALVRDGHYADIPFGQVQTGFRSIGGTMSKPVPYTLRSECGTADDRHCFSGSLVTYLPHTGRPDSAANEWYILHFPAPHLNGARTVFGRVVSGLEVVRAMRPESRLDQAIILSPGAAAPDPVVLDDQGRPVAYSAIMAGRQNGNGTSADPPDQRKSADPNSR